MENKADMRGKKLTTPEVAKRMLRLKVEDTTALLLGENYMKFVPRDVSLFVNVTVLHLNKNQLSNLPDHMAAMTKLVTLFADSNLIKQIPSWIGGLTNLKNLNLGKSNKKDLLVLLFG
jgi:Leucine-rich repeat (LRR) protein